MLLFAMGINYAQSNLESVQRHDLVDSLKRQYFQSNPKNLDLLVSLLQEEPNPDSMLKYGKILFDESIKDSSNLMTFQGFLHLGNGHILKGELSQGLEYYFEGLKYA
ncbi:hypothetical protein, partial [Algoriphagus sp.]|uniref:hypothetical protein n=1 Tax=Algoriphagus sp. TaxID=1872435 RepID=UPI0025DD6733